MTRNAVILIFLAVLLISPVMAGNITFNNNLWMRSLALQQPPSPGYHYQSFYQSSVTVAPINAYIIGFTIGGNQNALSGPETIGSGGLLNYDGEWTTTLNYADGTTDQIYLKTFHSFPFLQECDLSYNGQWWNSTEFIEYSIEMGIAAQYYDNYTAITYINFAKGHTEGTSSYLMPVSFYNNPITSITIQGNTATGVHIFWVDHDQLATEISKANALKATSPADIIALGLKIWDAAFKVLGVIWLFIDWFVIKGNILLSIVLYELGCAAYYANKAPDIFIFFSKMMKANRSLLNFLINSVSLTIGIVQTLLNLINPLKYL
jgi:hypothetical protein